MEENEPAAATVETEAGAPAASESAAVPEEIVKELQQTVCICKGIPLGTILRGIQPPKGLAGVQRRTGAGSGGCKGRRCSPKISALLARIETDVGK